MEISWIDFSDKDRKKVMDVLEIIHDSQAVDELGIGLIRDHFADIFFPGTSTIQTRAKYFLLIPYIFKDLEKEKIKTTRDFMDKLDKKEEKCARLLLEIARENKEIIENNGIIGSRNLIGKAPKWVKRRPSEIYWGGLKTYGIFTQSNYSLSEYVKYLTNKEKNEENTKFWLYPNTYQENWMEELKDNGGIELNKEEAEYLKEQIIAKQGNTLLGYLLQYYMEEFASLNNDKYIFDNLEDLIMKKHFPNELKEEYIYAKNISNFLYCAQLRYNIIYIDEKYSPNVEENYKNELMQEWQDYSKKIDKIANSINLEYIEKNIYDKELNDFLKNLLEEMRSTAKLEEKTKKIDQLVIDRENGKKPGKAKLNKKHTEKISSGHGIGKIIYRADRAQQVIADIMKGLK